MIWYGGGRPLQSVNEYLEAVGAARVEAIRMFVGGWWGAAYAADSRAIVAFTSCFDHQLGVANELHAVTLMKLNCACAARAASG